MLCGDNHLPCIVCASVSETATEPGHTLDWDQTRYCARTLQRQPDHAMCSLRKGGAGNTISTQLLMTGFAQEETWHGGRGCVFYGMLQTEVSQRGQQISDLLSATMNPIPSARMPEN